MCVYVCVCVCVCVCGTVCTLCTLYVMSCMLAFDVFSMVYNTKEEEVVVVIRTRSISVGNICVCARCYSERCIDLVS